MGRAMTVAELLNETQRLGIELAAHGDRLRYHPRSAMTPDLAERLRKHKAELLVALRTGSDRSDTEGIGHNGWPPTPDGWTRSHWIDRLRQLAGRCEPYVLDRATWLRSWSDFLEEGN